MARQSAVELVSGVGRAYRSCAAVAWSLTALLLLSLSGRLPGLLLLIGAVVLIAQWPWRRRKRGTGQRVRLFLDGEIRLDGAAGHWTPGGWTTAWLTVLPVRIAGCRRLVFAAWRNDPDAYRVLRTWLRHPPEQAGPSRCEGLQ